jgi:hypothetical protein
MGDRRFCWLDAVPSALVWMDIVVAIVLIVVSTVFGIVPGISNSNEYGFPFACDEYVFFLEYIDALFCED